MSKLRELFLQKAAEEYTASVVAYKAFFVWDNKKRDYFPPKDKPSADGKLWGEQYYLRDLTPAESDELAGRNVRTMIDADSGKVSSEVVQENSRAYAAVKFLCDETGKRIFTDADAALLGRTAGWRIINDIFLQGSRHAGMVREAPEEEAKNSENQASASGMTSPGTSASQTRIGSNGELASASSTAG